MLIARSRADLRRHLADLAAPGFVPTMGALHAGHLALVRAAGADGAPVVASIFVNPTQFAAHEDLARYPRDEAGDLAALAEAGCAVAFVPGVDEIYPPGDATGVVVRGPAQGWEGERRPGHFAGVATVVTRLFGLVRPATAWFGEKDWQQLQVVRRITADLCLPVAIRGLATVREADGLAMSSRNRYLDPARRAVAAAFPATCEAVLDALRAGGGLAESLAGGAAALEARGFAVDYLALVDPETLRARETARRPGRLIAAARLGDVRLLDNFAL